MIGGPSLFSTRTYMVVDLIHFSVLWRIYTVLFFCSSLPHGWCSQVVWLGVTGVWYSSLILRFPFGGGVFSKMVGDSTSALSPSSPVASLSNMVGNVGVQSGWVGVKTCLSRSWRCGCITVTGGVYVYASNGYLMFKSITLHWSDQVIARH